MDDVISDIIPKKNMKNPVSNVYEYFFSGARRWQSEIIRIESAKNYWSTYYKNYLYHTWCGFSD